MGSPDNLVTGWCDTCLRLIEVPAGQGRDTKPLTGPRPGFRDQTAFAVSGGDGHRAPAGSPAVRCDTTPMSRGTGTAGHNALHGDQIVSNGDGFVISARCLNEHRIASPATAL